MLFALLFQQVAFAVTAELTWTPPTTREDGSPLLPSEIGGYRVYYGTAPGDYMYEFPFTPAPAVGTTTVDFSPGTYYLVVTTVDTAGRESRFSLERTLTFSASSSPPMTVSQLLISLGVFPTRTVVDLQALYEFSVGVGSGTVYDVSGVGSQLNLIINDPSFVSWGVDSLTINQPTIISSLVSATKLNTSITASNEITIETWISPANITQGGPARIFSMSNGTSARNLTLGQEADFYDVRLRTTTTGINGDSPSLSSPVGSLTTNLTHVVYTRDATGTALLYINNVLVSSVVVAGDLSNWDSTYQLMIANEFTSNRPWLGTFDLIAIYSRALTTQEIKNNYMVGPNP